MYWPVGAPQIYAHHVALSEKPTTSEKDGGIKVSTNGDHEQHNEHDTVSVDERDIGEHGSVISDDTILHAKLTRNENILVTISSCALNLWLTRPMVLLARLRRSQKSLDTYGANVGVHVKPDGSTLVLETSLGFLIMHNIETNANARVYQQQSIQSQSRKQSIVRTFGTTDTEGFNELLIRFRKTIKIDAGIKSILTLDQELIIATVKPAAVQCVRWETQKGSHQTSTQLLGKMSWIENKASICHMVHDRAMNLSVWLNTDGAAYAVRRLRPQVTHRASSEDSSQSNASSVNGVQRLFEGYQFYCPQNNIDRAHLAAINARFSLIALATGDGQVLCFAAKDYAGNIPLSHKIQTQIPSATPKRVTSLSWSPDGYCLFVGYENGWSTWSTFGNEGASSSSSNSAHAEANDDPWLLGVETANWISTGLELLLTCPGDSRIWKLDFSRSAAAGCFSCANLVRALHQSSTELTIYRGHELSDLTSISNEASLWHHAQYPVTYAYNQWPIRTAVISQDGRYVAVAGKRGLAHYSVSSGRWRTFSSLAAENSFTIRGGLCWFGHILAAATEHAQGYDLRLYSRDQDLGRTPLHVEPFPMPIAFIGPSGEDSLLVYTYENMLYHFILNVDEVGTHLLQVGQIAFHGVVRAPSRVRSVSWILPEEQLRNGDPSRDVEHATILFLIDDKLALLQPTTTPENSIKYDMRVIAHQVEYYILMRDQLYFNFNDTYTESVPPTPSPGMNTSRSQTHYSLRDSLWYFTGTSLHLWSDIHDVLHTQAEVSASIQAPLSVPVDFYPLSILLNRGIVLGTEAESLQRRDLDFAQFRSLIRTQLFLPYVLKYHLLEARDTSTAFALAHQYQNLSYFPHALEILLHIILESVADQPRNKAPSDSIIEPIPAVLSFLQVVLSPEGYLSTIVQCIRKTEFSFWKHIFRHLPSPEILFEQALVLNDLKTASGYLIVMQTLEEEGDVLVPGSPSEKQLEGQVIRLMRLARAKNDFELCSELARFMMAVDPAGTALRNVIQKVGFANGTAAPQQSSMYLQPQRARLSTNNIALQERAEQSRKSLGKLDVRLTRILAEEPKSAGAETESVPSRSSIGDYFSASPGGY